MREPHPTDAELARRMLEGDERAFQEFFDGHFPRLFRFALTRLGGNADAAEEAAQAALCLAVTRLQTFRGEATLFTWLCTICRHEIARHLRSSGPSGSSLALPEDEDSCRAALESLAAADGGDPEALFRKEEIARLVQVTLDSLPWRYASALEWKYLRDVPVREIAERLGLGLKATESLLVRARAAFRDGFTSLEGARWNLRPSGGE